MNVVGRFGSLIAQGVYSVSTPIHPFGGAVDIIVVQQPDGSFCSAPWYVRFGKFQGVLKGAEKIVRIEVNGAEANFHMYLDNSGEAYFVREKIPGKDCEGNEGLKDSVSLGAAQDNCSSIDYDGNDSLREENFNTYINEGSFSDAVEVLQDEQSSLDVDRIEKMESDSERAVYKFQDEQSPLDDSLELSKYGSSRYENVDSIDNLVESQISSSEVVLVSVDGHILTAPISSSERDTENVQLSIPQFHLVPAEGTEFSKVNTEYSTGEATSPANYLGDLDMSSHKFASEIVCNANNNTKAGECQLEVHEGYEEDVRQDQETQYIVNQERVQYVPNNLNHVSVSVKKGDISQSCLELHELVLQVGNAKQQDRGEAETGGLGIFRSSDEEKDPRDKSPRSILADSEVEDRGAGILISSHRTSYPESDIPSRRISSNLQVEAELITTKAMATDHNLSAGIPFSSFINDDEYKEHIGREQINSDQHELPSEDECTKSQTVEPETYPEEMKSDVPSGMTSPSLQVEAEFIKTDMMAIDHDKSISIPINSLSNDILCEEHISKSQSAEGDCSTSQTVELQTFHEEIKSDVPSSMISPCLQVEAEPVTTNKMISDNNLSVSIPVNAFSNDDECEDNIGEELIPCDSEGPASESESAKSQTVETQISQKKTKFEISLCRNLLSAGMGLGAAAEAFDSHCISEEEFKLSAASIIKNENLVIRFQHKYLSWDKAAPIVLGTAAYGLDLSVEQSDAIPVEEGGTPKPREADYVLASTPSGRRWRLWSIPSLRRARKLEHTASGSSTEKLFVDSESGSQNQHVELTQLSCSGSESPHKQLHRTNVPTSDEIASLGLKEGKNMVNFIFSAGVLGRPNEVHAHIYLWKWNTRIVISDVDGTITKSDVLGQFMPLVGKDWTQLGVARLFSAIKENGYQLLFLSARAIVQAYLTRRFLVNLKQDGKALPHGPVVISPDGLFPSLYREVIRRAPHEFKIACLEDIKALFPSDYNPFYAGFGNRDTDELSYRKVGIPKGKIFIINPKGEVAISHRINVKSYTSLHTLVNDMFPPTTMVEQEDYNSWNYWRVPLPDIDNL